MNTTNNVSTPLDDRQEYVKELAAEYKIPEPWGIGPVRNASRRCTDKCCYVLFLMVLVAMIGVAIWAILASDPRGVTKVYDSSGNVCGKDAAVNYPILYLQTFERPFKSVCVSECPSFDYNQIKYNSNGVSTYPDGGEIPELDFYQFIANYAGNSYTTAPDLTESESFGYNPSWANGYFTQDQWKAYTSNYKINCLPNKQFSNCKVDNLKFYAYDSYDVMQKVCTPLGTKSGLMFTKVQALARPIAAAGHVGLEINRLPGGAAMNATEPADAREFRGGKIPVIRIAHAGIFHRQRISSRISRAVGVILLRSAAPRCVAVVQPTQRGERGVRRHRSIWRNENIGHAVGRDECQVGKLVMDEWIIRLPRRGLDHLGDRRESRLHFKFRV